MDSSLDKRFLSGYSKAFKELISQGERKTLEETKLL